MSQTANGAPAATWTRLCSRSSRTGGWLNLRKTIDGTHKKPRLRNLNDAPKLGRLRQKLCHMRSVTEFLRGQFFQLNLATLCVLMNDVCVQARLVDGLATPCWTISRSHRKRGGACNRPEIPQTFQRQLQTSDSGTRKRREIQIGPDTVLLLCGQRSRITPSLNLPAFMNSVISQLRFLANCFQSV